MLEENNITLASEKNELDLLAIFKGFWDERRTIIKITIVFIVIGLFIAVFSEKKYTSSTTFVPLYEGKSISSGLGGLASLAGINLGGNSSSSEISPELYPQIVKSIPFQKELLYAPLLVSGHDTLITYKAYYERIYSMNVLGYIKKYTIGLPSVIISLFKSNTEEKKLRDKDNLHIISLSNKESELIKKLESQIKLEVYSKEGFVTISVTMPDASLSSQLTLKAQELLQKYALNFKTQKSILQLKYIEARFLEKQKEFKEIKIKLARFQDENNSINTALGRTKLIELQSDYDLMFNIYNELAKQLEMQRLQVKHDTPLFTVIKPVSFPKVRSAPKRFLILFTAFIMGLSISLMFVKVKHVYYNLKKDWDLK